ncbi:hypothetical protein JTE90_011031 [Oedothorax gibbosus]|uniref:MKRN2 opposite strand protein n=1 Tax=Oedothorax gibbosus TaxID=931172 RepID=A0AAV6VE08_9ARAC|nr:hypothetical protein JTE90_011031 [Oedothorax gibbosus]
MMNNDPGIICFQHCLKNAKVFTFKFPDTCHFCRKDLSNTELRIPPFKVPYPFCKGNTEPNILVIKPTIGDFLNHYENSSDLHIGVTDSTGLVYEYDMNGKEKSSGQTWLQCLPIKVVENITFSQKIYWDQVLTDVFNQSQWTSEWYNQDSHNCYSFVLTFLRSLQFQELHPYLKDKTTFCEQFVLPQACIAAKYISLYRQVKTESIVIKTTS